MSKRKARPLADMVYDAGLDIPRQVEGSVNVEKAGRYLVRAVGYLEDAQGMIDLAAKSFEIDGKRQYGKKARGLGSPIEGVKSRVEMFGKQVRRGLI